MSSPDKSLIEDSWLDALTILRDRQLSSYEIGKLLHQTRFSVMSDPHHVAHVASLQAGRIAFRINPKILTFPRIERAEYFLSMALEAHRYIADWKWEDFRSACCGIGCDYSNSINPRERWRWIEMQRGAEKMWFNSFSDDRRKCLYCDKPMPTNSDCHPVREGVHENCGYELDALMEKVKRIEEEKEEAVGKTIDLMQALQKSLAEARK